MQILWDVPVCVVLDVHDLPWSSTEPLLFPTWPRCCIPSTGLFILHGFGREERIHLRYAMKVKVIAETYATLLSLHNLCSNFNHFSVPLAVDENWVNRLKTSCLGSLCHVSWSKTNTGLIYKNIHMVSGCATTVGSEISLGRLGGGQNAKRCILSG